MTKATLCSSGVPRLLYVTNQSVLGSQRGSPHSSSRSRVTASRGRQAPSGSGAAQVLPFVLEALTFHILGAVGSPAAQWEPTCLHAVDEEVSALTHQHGNLGSPGGNPQVWEAELRDSVSRMLTDLGHVAGHLCPLVYWLWRGGQCNPWAVLRVQWESTVKPWRCC